jgi:hypothetical protein
MCSRNPFLLAAILAMSLAAPSAAQGPVGTRASGMSGAFVAVADDATAVYWNPAGLATGSFVSAVIDLGQAVIGPVSSQTIVNQEDTTVFVGVSATAIGVAYYRVATYGRPDEPEVNGDRSREEVGRGVHALTTSVLGSSLVQSLSEHIVVGATPKIVRTETGKDFDVDAGVMVSWSHFHAGVVGRNLTTPTFDTEDGLAAVELGREVRVGGAWGSGWSGLSRVIIAVDGDVMSRPTPAGDRRDLAGGVETWWFNRRLGVRGGISRSTIGEAREALSGGLSLGVTAGMLIEGHVARGDAEERSWSVGLRMVF